MHSLARIAAPFRHDMSRPEPSSVEAPKTRDAERSRAAILSAAEELFSTQGFTATSLSEIALSAGLSRGAPNYFFGSKAQLYAAVLERVFRDRSEATGSAFRPLVRWAQAATDEPLARVLEQAVNGYMDFLLRRPSFLKLVQREELAGGEGLRDAPRASHAMEEAFQAVRAVAHERGLRAFDVADAVLLFVSLTYSPLAQRSTFLTTLGRDLEDPTGRRKHVELVVGQLLHLVGPGGVG